MDISYINISGTFYYLASLLDGMSRSIVHFEIHEPQIELLIQRAREKYPTRLSSSQADVKPRIISDNGPQFIAKDFKQFIRICGMTHVKTLPIVPARWSNGKLERFHKTIKSERIRPGTPLSLEDARRLVEGYVQHYNTVRLHSAIGYVTPADKLAGREKEIHEQRDHKLNQARETRRKRRSDAIPAAMALTPQAQPCPAGATCQ